MQSKKPTYKKPFETIDRYEESTWVGNDKPIFENDSVNFNQYHQLNFETDVSVGNEWHFFTIYDFNSHDQHQNWNTLFRGRHEDHHLLIQYGSNLIGTYDNGPHGFVSSGLNVSDYSGKGLFEVIGKNNMIREYVTINPGTAGGGSKTVIGNNCLFMISSHVAHDCIVGNNVIIANNVPLGGHVTIEDSVIIGGNSAVQQFTRIGRLAMIGGMTGVLKDVIPFGLSFGNRNYLEGLNLIGLRRKKYENQKIMELNNAYKEIFKDENFQDNLSKINGQFKNNELINEVISFIAKDKKRPICTPKKY